MSVITFRLGNELQFSSYLLVHKAALVSSNCTGQGGSYAWTLLRLTRSGIAESIVIDQGDALAPKQLLPDGVGGVLIRRRFTLAGIRARVD